MTETDLLSRDPEGAGRPDEGDRPGVAPKSASPPSVAPAAASASPSPNGAGITGGASAEPGDSPTRTRGRRGAGLTAMLLPELQAVAGGLGITGTARMRKGQLISAIQAAQSGPSSAPSSAVSLDPAARSSNGSGSGEPSSQNAPDRDQAAGSARVEAPAADTGRGPDVAGVGSPVEGEAGDRGTSGRAGQRSGNQQRDQQGGNRQQGGQSAGQRPQGNPQPAGQQRGGQQHGGQQHGGQQANQPGNQSNQQGGFHDDEYGEGGRRRRGRFRERGRNRPRTPAGGGFESEPVVREDDVLIPVAGILDVLESYAFVRTSGYLAGPNDVYVSLAQVRRYGLRRGDAVTGAVRQQQDGDKREKFNALLRLDTINGVSPEETRERPEFTKLTPLYPQERLRLETEPHLLTTRVIDLVMPLGKGQRALIVSPPKAGKTMVLQAIANAITTNNPECHLMVVLVDERPEEVTDMQRSVKGEVIASTFDRPPSDHTTVAELSIERAKRLVELGHDVVVLLDSITRLGRAYNLAAPVSGRILSGGVDSTALYPPKRFLGAARNIENGGSLTIMATALVETGSTMDTVIFEEFKGTGNAELKLDRRLADKRIFPAVDVDASGTRKEEILLVPEELAIVIKLRRVLHALEGQQSIELLLDRIKQTRSNYEFLMQIAKNAPGD